MSIHSRFDAALLAAEGDLQAFAAKDPASRGRIHDIAFGYSSYKAVLHYRLVRALNEMVADDNDATREIESVAALVSSRGKLLSGAEIHPRRYIGQRFVLDHGWAKEGCLARSGMRYSTSMHFTPDASRIQV
ncbi:hypothetical protein WN982_39445 [Paraburkholderia sp. IMGN_8]|uniref:hypothetical protein n=1 Tax=Paraburkholderia sp. IMGN_8 TaxID=3136564 RepID=UPI003100F348